MVNTDELYYKEHKRLREELNHLKECQVKYFTVSITATGLILGIIARFNSADLPSIFYALPLTILLPAWIVFFDKAKTITRIVAYYRLIEALIIGKIEFDYVGWENSLKLFRDLESKKMDESNNQNKEVKTKNQGKNKGKDSKEKLSKTDKEKSSINNNKGSWIERNKPPVGSYWFWIYFSFFGLSLVSILIPLVKEFMFLIISGEIYNIFIFITIIVISIFFGLVAHFNWKIYKELTEGRHSYDSNVKMWCELFYINYEDYTNQIKPKNLKNKN